MTPLKIYRQIKLQDILTGSPGSDVAFIWFRWKKGLGLRPTALPRKVRPKLSPNMSSLKGKNNLKNTLFLSVYKLAVLLVLNQYFILIFASYLFRIQMEENETKEDQAISSSEGENKFEASSIPEEVEGKKYA